MASADRGRACLEAVRVAGQLLREWGDDLVALATTNGGDDLIEDAREVCRSMLSRLEGISGRIEEVQDTRREGVIDLTNKPASCHSSPSRQASGERRSEALSLSPCRRLPSVSWPSSPAAPPARSVVLQSPDLLHTIVGFLMDGRSTSRLPLKHMSEVCRAWRDVCRCDDYWEPIAKDLFPVLRLGGGAVTQLLHRGGRVGTYRHHCLDYGRALLRREVAIGEPWYAGLQLSFEIFDASDGHCFISATGPIGVAKGDFIEFRLQGVARRELRGPPFSAASRDPQQRRFMSVRDYFERAHLDEFASSICVRVTVTDVRSGRMALLWEVQSVKRVVKEPNDFWEAHLPAEDGSFVVVEDGWVPVNSSRDTGPELTGLTNFYVVAEPGQEGVPEVDKLYRLAGGDEDRYQDHLSFFALLLKPADTDIIKRFIRSLLDKDP